ncbi:hypothetical protein SAMN04488026_10692 [Aliiruegeria lutimaris]|uniref:Uncharacterized protein n=1 Tax=Aliiruegeria lutimaris TaxID=571298 RepID=A0A1G9HL79_9RHOB|nr:hypothetical protein SAMN04488026_10692 [Aliiruegeria lutimaris]
MMQKPDNTSSTESDEPASRGTEKVPEEAEDMAHVLRRLNAEKEEKRRKNPGLYL